MKVTRLQGTAHEPDYTLYFTVVLLSAVGVITVYSASTVLALHSGMAPDHYALRQLVFAIIGIVLMTALIYLPSQLWYRTAAPLLLIAFTMLLLVLVPGIGHMTAGGRRWLGPTSLRIQPSEIAIVATCLYLAFFFTRKASVLDSFKRGLRPALVVIGLNFGLIVLEPDLGTALTLAGTALVVVFASGARLRPLFLTFGALAPIAVGLALSSRYRTHRLTTFLHPFAHQSSTSYQLLQGWTAISAGGWFGRGYDMSLAKTGYLPAPQTDFIFPVFVEEWGYVGAIALLVTFGVLIWRGFSIARQAGNRFGSLVAVGVTSMITVKTIINLGAVTGLLPVTGIPLPFMSYGGSSLIVNMAAIGLLLNVSRYTIDTERDPDSAAVDARDADFRDRAEPWSGGRDTRSRPRPVPTRQPVHGAARSAAKVQPLPPLNKRRKPTTPERRGAQRETAATNVRGSDARRRSADASKRPQTWRERNERASTPRPADNARRRSNTKSGLFRRDK